MNILYLSIITTSLLVIALLLLVFFEAEFKLRKKLTLYRDSFRLLAGSAIFCLLITVLISFLVPAS